MENHETKKHWLDRPVIKAFPGFTIEILLVMMIILLGILSRFVILGERTMAHDEVNHVEPSYRLYKGSGYVHDPVTHGPLQFHLIALSYFLFGDNDFSSRLPHAIFSIATICVVLFAFRRYLGRVGALVGGLLFLISPFILYYGRYARNEAFIELFAVLMIYGFLRYMERHDDFSLYLLAIVTSLHFATKETAYIYAAQFLFFCGLIFLKEIWCELPWRSGKERLNALAFLFIAAGVGLIGLISLRLSSGAEGSPANPLFKMIGLGLVAIAGLILVGNVFLTVKKFGWHAFKEMPSFNLIVLIGTLILPQMTALPIRLIGKNPLDYSAAGMTVTIVTFLILFAVSLGIGFWWNRHVFLRAAIAFYLIFIVFYTTLFSNGQGFFTGVIGSLGYWLSQHEVQRGGQPAYYYGAILLPLYEYAAIMGTLAAVWFTVKYRLYWTKPGDSLKDSLVSDTLDEYEVELEIFEAETTDGETSQTDLIFCEKVKSVRLPTILLFFYWAFTALIAYSIAGEKMPWLAVHIAIPLALSGAWGIGFLLEQINWKKVCTVNGLVNLALLITGSYALGGVLNPVFGKMIPFAGKELHQLKATNQFVLSFVVLLIALIVLFRIWRKWGRKTTAQTLVLFFLTALIGLQARTAYVSSFINYDYANELLVYAHGAPGPKTALHMVEEVAARMGEGKSIKVAYDNETLYPYWWYFRDYPNKNYFVENITRDLRNYDIIFSDVGKEGKLEPVVRNGYYRYHYVRLWWPNQDYWNLTWARVAGALSDPAMRGALFDIWLNRDYKAYAKIKGKTDLTPETWQPAARMVMFMKKDILRKMFQLGDATIMLENGGENESGFTDEKFVALQPALTIGGKGGEDGKFTLPRGVAVAPSGRVYVLDSDNNRVEYFDAAGKFLGKWDAVEIGKLNQPWGIAIDEDGNVFIADTWNHRMLKYTADGELIRSWNAADLSFYGPRSIAISSTGKVYISDTGNKRIMIYDDAGKFLAQFGSTGMAEGEFDEPVGIALWQDTVLAVADTWNQRVQLFDVSGTDGAATMIGSFPVQAWYSQSLDNKPYVAFTKEGNVLVSDPEGALIWEYTQEGVLLRSWNGAGGDIDRKSMPTGITVDKQGNVWVVDTINNQVNKFILPSIAGEKDSPEK